MKVAYLCTQDISNQIFIDTFKKYNLEIEVIIFFKCVYKYMIRNI